MSATVETFSSDTLESVSKEIKRSTPTGGFTCSTTEVIQPVSPMLPTCSTSTRPALQMFRVTVNERRCCLNL
jgi:hypothetical protein